MVPLVRQECLHKSDFINSFYHHLIVSKKKKASLPKMLSLPTSEKRKETLYDKQNRKRIEKKKRREEEKTLSLKLSMSSCSQNLLELALLLRIQTCRELDLDADNEVASFVWFLALGHAQVGVAVFVSWRCGTAGADANLLAIDCLDGSGPAGQGFFQCDVDVVDDVVAFALVQGVFFL